MFGARAKQRIVLSVLGGEVTVAEGRAGASARRYL
jgi:hypothetical protein